MNSGKKMSPMRAFQYSSALDTHSYPAAPALETELDLLNRQIRQKDNEIRSLKKNLDYFQAPTPLKDVGKNISFTNSSNSYGAIANKHFYDSPVIQKTRIQMPDSRFNAVDPITGMKRNSQRSYSPFQDIGKRCVDSYTFNRPFFH